MPLSHLLRLRRSNDIEERSIITRESIRNNNTTLRKKEKIQKQTRSHLFRKKYANNPVFHQATFQLQFNSKNERFSTKKTDKPSAWGVTISRKNAAKGGEKRCRKEIGVRTEDERSDQFRGDQLIKNARDQKHASSPREVINRTERKNRRVSQEGNEFCAIDWRPKGDAKEIGF